MSQNETRIGRRRFLGTVSAAFAAAAIPKLSHGQSIEKELFLHEGIVPSCPMLWSELILTIWM